MLKTYNQLITESLQEFSLAPQIYIFEVIIFKKALAVALR